MLTYLTIGLIVLVVVLIAVTIYLAVKDSNCSKCSTDCSKCSGDCTKCPNDCTKCPKDCSNCPSKFPSFRIKSVSTGKYMAKDFTMTSAPQSAQIVTVGTSNTQSFIVPSFGVTGNFYNLSYIPDKTNTFGVLSVEAFNSFFIDVSGNTATGKQQTSAPINTPAYQVVLEPV